MYSYDYLEDSSYEVENIRTGKKYFSGTYEECLEYLNEEQMFYEDTLVINES